MKTYYNYWDEKIYLEKKGDFFEVPVLEIYYKSYFTVEKIKIKKYILDEHDLYYFTGAYYNTDLQIYMARFEKNQDGWNRIPWNSQSKDLEEYIKWKKPSKN